MSILFIDKASDVITKPLVLGLNVYIFESIDKLTERYHSDGGAVVVAASIERAKELLKEEGAEVGFNEGPTHFYPCADAQAEKVFIFPDAGYC